MKEIIVDTSSIIFGLMNKVDVFERINEELGPCTIIVSNGIVNELHLLGERDGWEAKLAKVGTLMLKKHNIKVIENRDKVDAFLIREAGARGYEVCTNDIELKKKLKILGVKCHILTKQGKLR